MKKRSLHGLAAIAVAATLMLPLAGCGKKKNIEAGSIWEITKTVNLSELTIAEGASIKVPEDCSLTMTVDGIETPIAPGSYNGKIVLTVNNAIIIDYKGMGTSQKYIYRAAIDIENGKYMAEKSVAAAAVGGTVTDTLAQDVKITSVGEAFNGIIVKGDSKFSYSIVNPVISLTGNGVNDFAGFGAAIMTDGKAEVTIENARINNTGAVRTAIWVGGNSITKINNSYIETHNGTLPEDYSWSWVKGGGGEKGDVMMEVPWMLGIIGNNRATTVVGNGTAYYNNSHIKAQAWGALSTDQVSADSRLYATNCHIETVESGYGAFADGSSNTYSGCKFDVADYGLIMQRGSAHFTDGTVVNSGRFGVMSYGGATALAIDKGCVFNAKKAVIQVKSGNPTILVDSSELNSESGVILQAMVNDDPNQGGGGGSRGTAGNAPGGAPGGTPDGGMTGGSGGSNSPVTANFKDMTLNGDIVTSMTAERDVIANFEKSSITGAITTAIAEHAVGRNGERLAMQEKTDLYYIIGEVTDTYIETDDKYGMKVTLDGDSTWIVDKTSYLTGLTVANGAAIAAPEGYSVIMTVDGVKKPIGAGDYKGRIVLKVTKG